MSHPVLHEDLVGKHVTLVSGTWGESLIVGITLVDTDLWILLQEVKTGALFRSRLENLNVVMA